MEYVSSLELGFRPHSELGADRFVRSKEDTMGRGKMTLPELGATQMLLEVRTPVCLGPKGNHGIKQSRRAPMRNYAFCARNVQRGLPRLGPFSPEAKLGERCYGQRQPLGCGRPNENLWECRPVDGTERIPYAWTNAPCFLRGSCLVYLYRLNIIHKRGFTKTPYSGCIAGALRQDFGKSIFSWCLKCL